MSDRDYCYPPDYTVLRNRLNVRAAPTLEAAERQLVAQRLIVALGGPMSANDDLPALRQETPPVLGVSLCAQLLSRWGATWRPPAATSSACARST